MQSSSTTQSFTAQSSFTAQPSSTAQPSQIARTLTLLDDIHGSVAVVGSMNADYTVTTTRLPAAGETVVGGPLQLLPGGKSGNQAAAAALLGATVRLFGAVGTDANADFLLGRLADAGVDTADVRHVPGPSGTTVITVDGAGENTIVYSPGANAAVDVDYITAHSARLAAASVLGLCLESPLETVTACAQIAHDAGLTVLVNDSPFIAQLPDALIACTDVLLVNEHELAQLLHIDEPANDDWSGFDWDDVRRRLHDAGFRRTIVTLGGAGSVVLDTDADADTDTAGRRESISHIDAVHVDAVDTTGCGDAFMGTVLAALASDMTLTQAARLASVVSAYAATGRGAQASYGTAAQIRSRFGDAH